MAASRRGLTNHNPFILIKEQFWKWGHSLGSAELEKRCSGSPLQLQGCFYPKISLCAQPDTDTRVPVSLGYSWDCAGPAKQHPEHDSGQAHRDRHWAGEGWGGPNTGPMRETGCAWVFRGAPQSGGQCRNRVRAGSAEAREDMFTLLVIHHFFLFDYRSNNPTIVQSTGRSTVPSAGFPMHGPSGLPPAPAVLLTLASSSWLQVSGSNMAKSLAAKRNTSAQ